VELLYNILTILFLVGPPSDIQPETGSQVVQDAPCTCRLHNYACCGIHYPSSLTIPI